MKKKILVVDDEADIVELLSRRLEDWGYGVLQATNGEDGLRLAQRERPDLVLLDIRMPRMSGLQVCAKLRNQTEQPRIPVIFLTALGRPEQIENGFQQEPDDYIVKPFEASDLKYRIEACLGKQMTDVEN